MTRPRNPLKLEARRQRAYAAGAPRPGGKQPHQTLPDIADDQRLCDLCHLAKWECEALHTASDDHCYSPMSVEAQVAYEKQQRRSTVTGSDGHFPGHASGCTMSPELCQALSGI